MPATFLFGEQLPNRPVKLVIPKDQRSEWTVATQLEDLGDRQYAAPNYYYFYDSPTMVGDIDIHRFQNGEQTIEVAYLTEDSAEDKAAYTEWVKQIVESQRIVYGELPAYDYGRYTFLCSYNPYIGGDGMEHRNSTICSAPFGLEGRADDLIGTVSHEFFHCWNVERIRPASLEPFDFTHANQSGELWFAEGFTSYYDDLTLVRTGIMSLEDYLDGLGGTLNYVYNRPGRDHRNPIEMSQQAPFVDAATANDENNFANTFVSYYPYGAVLGLTLDLQLRQRDHDLDEYMKLVWRRYGKPEIPYHVNDLELALGDLTADPAWAKAWFERHVYGSALVPVAELLAPFGIEVNYERPDSVSLDGLRLRTEDTETGGVMVRNKVMENHPLYAAGVDRNSVIFRLNGEAVTTLEDWGRIVAGLEIGQRYEVGFTQLGRPESGEFVAAVSPNFKLDVSKRKNKLRKQWLQR
jgi:predicted metalloprotease with PDZ domain